MPTCAGCKWRPSAHDPGAYRSQISRERLSQHYLPLDPELWQLDRFQDFLAQRRALVAEGINSVFRDLE